MIKTRMDSWLLAVALLVAATPNGWTCSEDGSTGFAPENNLKIAVDAKKVSTIDEAKFNKIIATAEKVYVPTAAAMGGKLTINRLWKDATVNANASRGIFGGQNWQINMFGGMARHPLMTSDGFLNVVCHEIGHHIGGAPKVAGGLFGGSWASNEGQSDYWASAKCLRTLWKNEDNAAAVSGKSVPSMVTQACETSFKSQNEIDLCVRVSLSGEVLAKVLRSLRGADRPALPPVDFTTPDQNVVDSTVNSHPEAQCRLDTYFAGGVCAISESVAAVQDSTITGMCMKRDQIGFRPACWFKE